MPAQGDRFACVLARPAAMPLPFDEDEDEHDAGPARCVPDEDEALLGRPALLLLLLELLLLLLFVLVLLTTSPLPDACSRREKMPMPSSRSYWTTSNPIDTKTKKDQRIF